MDNSAIIPDAPILSPEADTAPIQKEEAIRFDQNLAALHFSDGWKQLKEIMDEDISKFKTGEFITKIEEKSLEEVGKLFVIHQTVASFLQRYVSKVEEAAKAVAENEQRT
jgi:hypothetical protein